jgi:hypothetical protein
MESTLQLEAVVLFYETYAFMKPNYIDVSASSQIAPLENGVTENTAPKDAKHLISSVFGAAPANTFAIVDAALIANLKEWLESSQLNYASLLQGEAQEELEDVAPYLVQITPESSAALQLLTRSPAPWHFWDSDGCIFIQSRVDLEKLRGHLRRLTRLKRPDGSWVFFRFWSPSTLLGLRRVFERSEPHVAAFFGEIIERMIVKVPNRDQLRSYRPTTPREAPASEFTLAPETVSAMSRYVPITQVHTLRKDAEARLRKHDKVTYAKMMKQSEAQRFANAKAVYRMGLDDPHQTAILFAIVYGAGLNILTEPAFHYATKNPLLAPRAKARQLIKAYQFIDKMKDN